MTEKKAQKTLEYRRARFLGDTKDNNLETLVRQSWEKFPNQTDRVVTFGDDRSIVGLRSKSFDSRGFALHCANYTDGQGVGTLSTKPEPEVNVQELPPPDGANFQDSAFMALIRGGDVVCLNCGRNAASLRVYLQRLFEKADLAEDERKFELVRIFDPKMLKRIEDVGVKGFDMKAGLSEADLSVISASGGSLLKRIFGKDDCLRHAKDSTATVMLSINAKGRADRSDITELAKDAAQKFVYGEESEEDFTIRLKNGQTIKSNEMSWRKTVSLSRRAKSVAVDDAWLEMVTYLKELEEQGVT